jgi:hypothetical protein
MAVNYEARFQELVAGRDWSIRRFAFATELAFLVAKENLTHGSQAREHG